MNAWQKARSHSPPNGAIHLADEIGWAWGSDPATSQLRAAVVADFAKEDVELVILMGHAATIEPRGNRQEQTRCNHRLAWERARPYWCGVRPTPIRCNRRRLEV